MSGAARIATVLRRDWRLFGPLALGIGAWQVLQRAVAEPDPLGMRNASVVLSSLTREPLRYLPTAAAALTVIAIATLIIVIVQEDDIPGPRGDWLTRPVKRFETLAAKALLVCGAVLIPDFIAGMVYALVQDAPVDAALLHAAGRTFGDLVGLVLPLFLLASMSSNMAEAAILALLATGAIYLLTGNDGFFDPTVSSPQDMTWIADIARLGAILAVGLPLTIWQYRRPNRWIVRGVAAAGVAAWIALAFVPRPDLARFNVGLSPDPAAGAAIVLPTDAPVDPAIQARVQPCSPNMPNCYPRFALPHAQGVPEDARVVLDASRLRAFDTAGKLIGPLDFNTSGPPYAFGIIASNAAPKGIAQKDWAAVLGAVREGRYRMEGDLTLTLLVPNQRVTLPVDGKRHFVRGFGSCRAASEEPGAGTVQVQCRPIGTAPNQMAVYAEGARPPRRCELDTSAGCGVLAAPLWARLILPQQPMQSYAAMLPGHNELPKTVDIQTRVVKAHVARILPLKPLAPVARVPAGQRPPPGLRPAPGAPPPPPKPPGGGQ